MDNQHRKIRGYRDFTQDEINTINKIKEQGAVLQDICDDLASFEDVDKRWLAIATADLQKGFMALIRSIAKPDSF